MRLNIIYTAQDINNGEYIIDITHNQFELKKMLDGQLKSAA